MWFGFNMKCVFSAPGWKCINEGCRNDSVCIFLVVKGRLVMLIADLRQVN